MARSQTKQVFRRISRRIRFYLPLALLFLIAMVLFLPISAPWMARWAGGKVSEILGADVSFERIEFTLATATLHLHGVAVGSGEAPFRVERIYLDGPFTGLIAGGGRWPAEVTMEGLSPIVVARDEADGWELRGEGRTLLGLLDGEVPEAAADPGEGRGATTVTRTPRLILRQAELRVLSATANRESHTILISEAEIPPRPDGQAPLHLTGRGLFIGDTIEDFQTRLVWFPGQRSLNVSADLSGFAWQFPIPAMEGLEVSVNDLSLTGHLDLREDRVFDVGFTARSGQFVMAESRVGGETWRDRDLEIRLKGRLDLATPHMRLDSLRLHGDEVEISASGKMMLANDYEGDVRVSINRLPGAALSMGTRELHDLTGIRVLTAGTSPTLTLAARASGPFARPLELDEELSLRLGGWVAEMDELPGRVDVYQLDMDIRQGHVNLARLDLKLDEFHLGARGKIPVYKAGHEGERSTGSLHVEARGDARHGARWLAIHGLLPREILRLDLPVDLDLVFPLALERSVVEGRPHLEAFPDEPTGQMRFGEGEVVLRSLVEPLRMQPAVVDLSPGRVDLTRMDIRMGGIGILLDGALSGQSVLEPLDAEKLEVEGDLIVRGNVRDIITQLRRLGLMDQVVLPSDLDGELLAELKVTGPLASVEELDYRGRVEFESLTTTIQTPSHPVHIGRLDTTIRVDRESLEINRFEMELHDPERGNTRVQLKATVDAEEIRLEGKARTHFEFLTAILARELADLVMEGPLPGSFTVRLIPGKGLGEGPDLIRRWVAYLTQEDLRISIRKDADLVVDYHVVYNQPYLDEQTDVRVFAREFPVPISRIRGNAHLTPEGVFLENMRADIGSSRDVRINTGHVRIAPPVKITFDAVINDINIDEWTTGWGEQPWASPPITFEPRWRAVPESRLMVEIDGKLQARNATFMRFSGNNIRTDFHLKLSSRRPPRLHLANLSAGMYGGQASGELRFLFPPGERPWFRADTGFETVDIHRFIFDLHEHPEEEYDRSTGLDGKLTGSMVFSGQLLNYPTYTGSGEFMVEESAIIGQVILPYARNIIRIGTPRETRMGTIRGDGYMQDQRIHFNSIEVVDPAMLLAANGYIDFQSRLFFEVSASVISQRLRNIPLVQYVGDIIDLVGKEAVYYYNLRGTLGEPTYFPVPRIVEHADRLGRLIREGISLFGMGPAPQSNEPERR